MAKRKLTPVTKTPIAVAGISSSIFQIAPDAIIVIDEAQNIVFFNQGAEKIFMYEAAEVTGRALELLLPEASKKKHRAEVEKFADSHIPARLKDQRRRIAGRRKNGEVFPGKASITRIVFEGKTYFAAIFLDITEEERREKQVGLQLAMTRAIAEADCFESALSLSLQMVCEITGWDYGEVWLPAPDGLQLQPGTSYCRADRDLERFREISRDFKFDMNVGLPGQVWATREPIWIPNVTVDANFPRTLHARAAGLRAAVGIPILAGERVVAVLNFFLRAERQEDENFVSLVSSVAAELGAVFARRHAEQALRESETFARGVLDSLPAHLCVLNMQGTILAINEAWAEFARENEANHATVHGLGMNYLEICERAAQAGDETARAALEGIRAVMGGAQESFDMEYPCHAPGEQRWFVMRVRPMGRRDGSVIVSHQTITERKLADTALQESEARYRSLFENSNDLIQSLAPDGSFLFVNEAWRRTLGYTDEEVARLKIFDVIHPDSLPECRESFRQVTEGKRVPQIQFQFISRDDRVVEVDGNASPRIMGGNVIATQGFFRDATERKRAEEALVESEKRYRALIENSADAITLLSPDGIVTYDSPAAPGLLGYAPEEWIGRNVFDIVHPDDLAGTMAAFKSTLEAPRRKAFHTFRVRDKGGSWRWVEATATNLLDEPSVRAIVVNYGDITERRRAQITSNLMQTSALAIAESRDFDSALDAALKILCEAAGWKYAEAWLPRFDASALDLGPVWYGGGGKVEKFRRASQEFTFHPGQGLPGRVWAKKTPEWIPDVSVNHETFLRAPQALEAGLRAGMGVPIIGNGEVLVVAFFMFECSPEDRAMMETAMAIGNQLGTMLLRKRAEDDNRRKTEDLLLIQSLNDAANRGDSIEEIFELLKDSTAKIYSSRGTAFYRVGEGGERLEIEVLNLPSDLVNRIEKLIGMKLPKPGVPLREGGLYREILLEGKPRLINDAKTIQRLMDEFTDNPALRKMVGGIYTILGNHSVMSVPMVSEAGPLGLLEVSRREPFIEADLRRLALIGGEVTAILQRKRAEENLLVSEEKFRTLTETLPIGVAVTTPKGEVIEANPALVKMLDYDSKEEFLRDPAFIHYRDPQDRSRYIAQLLERGATMGYEFQLARKGGSFFWASASAVTQRHPDGSITLVHSVEDITVRKHRQDELETLLAISQIVTQTSDLETLLQNILDAVVNVLPAAEKGAILLADEAGNLRIRAMSGYSDPRILGSIFPSISGYSARAFRLREPLIVAEARAEEEIRYDGEIGEMATVQSAMVAPLNAQGQAIGVIAIDNVTRANAFTEEDLRLLITISSSIALAIHRARLLDETRQRLERVQGLREIDITIANTFDLRQMLDVVLKQSINLLGVDAASVLLLDPTSYRLEFAAGLGFRTRLIESVRLPIGKSFAGRALLERRLIQVSDYGVAQENPDFADFWIKEGINEYFVTPLLVKGQVKGALEVFHRAPRSSAESLKEWIGFLETLAGQAALAVENIHLFEDLQRANVELSLAYDATIEGWSQAMDLRDKETEGHTQRVTRLTMELARSMGVAGDELVHVRRGALLHDIGKMGVPDGILLKPDKLTEEEWTLMKRHPTFAYDMLSPIAYLKPALDIPYCHHEKWDGTGYPRGLRGEQIPLAARLFTFVDVYDALTSDRPYRQAWSKEKTLEYIREQSGKHFDPSLVNMFLSVIEEYEEHSQ